ncbi:MAG: cysteine--tRNA ligase [Alphaproteobacteria bacterium]
MALVVYNTLTRRKEPFVPLDPQRIGMYVCGPTVYDFAHIGNARPVVVFDVLYRLLCLRYGRVTYVRNITDVDDKIIAAARANGESIADLTARTEAAFHDDMRALGSHDPTIEPHATAHIAPMIAMIETLIAKHHAYAADGHVLFSVPSMEHYGALSGRNRDEMIAGARVEVAPYKKDPADFVLWKPSEPDQPGWPSPWGRGRPGWHIECSAMSATHLGITFDIHGGGLDLVFPHHENEIAQSRCAHDGAPLARYWMHNGYVVVEGQKMSKSLGNFVTVRDLLRDAPGEAIRLVLLGAHYRQPLDFTRAGLQQGKQNLDRLYGALRAAATVRAEAGPPPAALLAALEDDLNTPEAVAELHRLATALNKATDRAEQARLKGALVAGGAMLGLLGSDPEAWFQGGGAKAAGSEVAGMSATGYDRDTIERLIGERTAARKARDFAGADAIRNKLADHGVILEDSPSGTTWRRG